MPPKGSTNVDLKRVPFSESKTGPESATAHSAPSNFEALISDAFMAPVLGAKKQNRPDLKNCAPIN